MLVFVRSFTALTSFNEAHKHFMNEFRFLFEYSRTGVFKYICTLSRMEISILTKNGNVIMRVSNRWSHRVFAIDDCFY